MGKPCTICAHPDRSAIDTAVEAGRPLRGIAAAYGVSKTSLHRHWQAHVFEARSLVEFYTKGKTPAPTLPTTQYGFLSHVKTIAIWVVVICVGVGYVWLVATAPQPTSGAQGGTDRASRLGTHDH
jgi:hypothetical protein